MSRTFRPFNTYMGKNTFGVLKEPQNSGDYILNKRSLVGFCPPSVCSSISRSGITQSDRLSLKKANALYFSDLQNPYDSADLNINLVTQLDLSGRSVIADASGNAPAQLSIYSIPYLDYTIDPSGSLFGNTICGATNFTQYLTYTDPSTNTVSPFIVSS